ncbi:hypothetical protein [Hoylesella shahii]|uniref:hypothetical protein n=1 Tax=Hoylesella shahii TaxID=228603 RepID=UPI0028E3A759|nr:hypothetical protein [Hoylesella shahii]
MAISDTHRLNAQQDGLPSRYERQIQPVDASSLLYPNKVAPLNPTRALLEQVSPIKHLIRKALKGHCGLDM